MPPPAQTEHQTVKLAYGRHGLTVRLPSHCTTVLEPRHVPGLDDEHATVLHALRHPVGALPLRNQLRPDSRVCVTFTDSTRATPNERLIPWLLAEVTAVVPPDRIVLVNQTGTHRPNTSAELESMLTPGVVRRFRVLNHDATDPAELVQLGETRDGAPALFNRHLVEADLRVITGFIEPHFFAGFSGGPKGIAPGCSGLATVMSNHGAHHISSPHACFGITEGNPLWEELRDLALRPGPSFLLNVTLNEQRQITGVFAGDLIAAHRMGTGFVRQSAMQPVDAPFDLVISTNSGHPLDLNLYQGVKGMSAASRILKPGGTLILACECCEGVPAGSHFDQLLRSAPSPRELLQRLNQPGFRAPEQWQAHIQTALQQHARILIHSSLPDATVRACHLEPCPDIEAAVQGALTADPDLRIAVLPQGPLTIPYLTGGRPGAEARSGLAPAPTPAVPPATNHR